MEDAALALIRMHQRDGGLDDREALAVRALAMAGPDLLILSTCHRVEIYGAAPAGLDPRSWIVDRVGLAGDVAALHHLTIETGGPSALHLMRVVAGLDSLIPGEGQILGQLRRAYDEVRGSGLHPMLGDLARAALRLGRELRAETPLGDVRRSVGSLAVDAGIALLDRPSTASALVIGAGEMGKLAARALAKRVGSLVIANRDPEHAREAALVSGARVAGLADVEAELSRADLVISAADTRGAVLTSERLRRRLAAGPLALVDIAVPRSVLAADRALSGLRYRSVDDLRDDVVTVDEGTLAEAERRCQAETTRFMRGRRARSASTTIEALHTRGERLRRQQLERALVKLGHLTERDRGVVAALADGLTKAFLHAPTVALRHHPERALVVRELFALDDGP